MACELEKTTFDIDIYKVKLFYLSFCVYLHVNI
jgi:hypothetical protein